LNYSSNQFVIIIAINWTLDFQTLSEVLMQYEFRHSSGSRHVFGSHPEDGSVWPDILWTLYLLWFAINSWIWNNVLILIFNSLESSDGERHDSIGTDSYEDSEEALLPSATYHLKVDPICRLVVQFHTYTSCVSGTPTMAAIPQM